MLSFAAPASSWSDALASHLPQPLKDIAIPPQYFVLVPATLLAVLLTYTLTKPSSTLNAAHRAAHRAATTTTTHFGSDREYTTKRSHGRATTVVLVGLSEAGKTSLFSALVYGTTPASLPSQKPSQAIVDAGTLAQHGAKLKPVMLVDVPGHPRLRPLVDEQLSSADGVVICVDAVMASKASTASSTRPTPDADADAHTITDVADLIHATLTTLAKQTARAATSNLAPPSVLVLFTRADLSPLLGGAAAGTDAAKDDKRRAQLLSRCRTTLESELGQRRANMGFGGGGAQNRSSARAGNVKIAALGKVADADPALAGSGSGGVFGWIKKALGLGGSGANGSADAEEEQEQEQEQEQHEDEVVDYIDWAASQRDELGASGFGLDKLDDHVVYGGAVQFALASVGKVRSWDGKIQQQEDDDDAPDDKKKDPSGGLKDFKQWIVELQS